MGRRAEAAVVLAVVIAGVALALRPGTEASPAPRPHLDDVLETARELGRADPNRPAWQWNVLLDDLERWGGGDPDLTPLLRRAG